MEQAQIEGSRKITRKMDFYNLDAIIAVGYRVNSKKATSILNKNKHLIIDGKQIISGSALVAITLMIAESRPEEKETMVKLVMNFLKI